jgi:hypothetical protein
METFKVSYFDERNLTKYCYIQAKDAAEATKLLKNNIQV